MWQKNKLIQNRYPIMVKCLNIGKPIYRTISTVNISVADDAFYK